MKKTLVTSTTSISKTGKSPKPTQSQKQEPMSRKPYGFCCDPAKDESLMRPEDDPMLSQVILDAGGPNFKIRLEEFDPMPPKRLPVAVRYKLPRNQTI